MDELKGKIAIVTGASKGIGAAIARRFAKAGASVVVNYASSKKDADKVVGDILRDGARRSRSRQMSPQRRLSGSSPDVGRVRPPSVLVNMPACTVAVA